MRTAPSVCKLMAYWTHVWIWAAAVGALLCGCNPSLPRVREDVLAGRCAGIPEGAAPVLCWRGERRGLFTYWGRQDVQVSVRAWLPRGLQGPADGRWEVTARNAEGKRLPFLGFLQYHVNENGTRLTVLTPPVDMEVLPDGLYTALRSELEVAGGSLRRVVLTAAVCEIRGHGFKPFMVKIPLVPEEVSALTPLPPSLPQAPAGTPVPFH